MNEMEKITQKVYKKFKKNLEDNGLDASKKYIEGDWCTIWTGGFRVEFKGSWDGACIINNIFHCSHKSAGKVIKHLGKFCDDISAGKYDEKPKKVK